MMPVQNLPEQQNQDQITLPPPAEAGRAQRGTFFTPLSLQQKFLRLAALLTTGYLCAMFFGHPLVFTNYYYNITESKQGFFLIASGLYLLALLFARIALPPDYGVPRKRAGVHPAAIALAALFCVSLVSSLISRYSGEAFFGENNRFQGLLTLFCYAGLVFALSRREIDLTWPERAFLLASCVVSVLGVLHHFGVDPIGFTTNLRAGDRGRFLSTIGNADFYAAYVVHAFSVTLGYFLRAESRNERIFSAVALALTCFGALVAGSDSAALGVLAAMLLVPLLLFSDAEAMRRLPLAWAVFFLSAFVLGLLSAALPSVTFLSSFFAALLMPALALSLLAASLALRLALRRVPQERLARAKRPYMVTLALVLLLGAIALVLLNTRLRELPLGGWERYLRFSESWGTDRGKIWTFVLEFYEKLPLAQKLFGASSGALFHADAVKPLFSDASLDTAHNEYLQYLVTNGLLGLLSYLAALVFAIRAGLLRGKTEPVYRGLTLAVAAYAVQATVNIAQPMTTPLLIVLVGVLVSRKPEIAAQEQTETE